MPDQSFEIADLDLAAATARIGDSFHLTLDDTRLLHFELVEATPLTSSPDADTGAANRSFSMLFRGPAEPLLNQGTVPMRNDTWGTCHLFVVPVDQDGEATYYEAIVNRPS
ncbi:MAG: hypothetical protein HKN44_02225 [Ilumatobacter sp.]|nr:hypothetical protein [Ilumatobacter sp.]